MNDGHSRFEWWIADHIFVIIAVMLVLCVVAAILLGVYVW